jgi:hypothetical protein
LTLHRPWCWSIVAPWRPNRQDLEVKDLENRTWPPWESIVGHYIAIHSGATWDSKAADDLRLMDYPVPDKADWTGGRIVGLVRVTGHVVEGSAEALMSMWFCGPVAWTLAEPKVFGRSRATYWRRFGPASVWRVRLPTHEAVG